LAVKAAAADAVVAVWWLVHEDVPVEGGVKQPQRQSGEDEQHHTLSSHGWLKGFCSKACTQPSDQDDHQFCYLISDQTAIGHPKLLVRYSEINHKANNTLATMFGPTMS
jgi:hypothetical protein